MASPLWMTEEEFTTAFDEDTKAEWLAGEVIIIPPASTIHVRLTGFLHFILSGFVAHHDLGQILGPELMIRLEVLRRRRVPDILFVAKEQLDIIKTNHIEGPPDLTIEIVSPDSLARDWREKYLEYEAAGVREYWVIDPMHELVEAYQLTDTKQYQVIAPIDDIIHSTVLNGFFLNPTWLWQSPLPNPLEILKTLKVL